MTPTLQRRRRPHAAAAAALALGAAAAPATARTVLTDGHVDAVAPALPGGRLRSLLNDGGTWRDPDAVTIRLGSAARVTLPAGMGFVGRRGTRAWLIPQAPRRGVVWAGWSTEAVPARAVRGGVTWTLTSVSGPGRVAIFQTGAFGRASILFSSARRLPQARTLATGTHAHGNWAFTRPGTYRLGYRLSARTATGRTLSDSSTLTFAVG